jgi:hypothetical protein
MNPMGKEHLPARLAELFAMGAEDVAREAVAEANKRLDLQQDYQVGVVLVDDVMGGWTDRYVNEAKNYFGDKAGLRRNWITTLLWAGDEPNPNHIRQAVLQSCYRAFYYEQYGLPQTLGQMMVQEGGAGIFAGISPHLDAEEIEYSWEVLADYLNTENYTVKIAGMYGDEVANRLGYPPLGLSHRAGFAVAIADAQ